MPDSAAWESRRALTDNPAASPETFRRVGRELLDLGQLAEALEFLGRAGDEEGLALILERAVAEGHFFLYQGAAARLGGFKRADLEKLAASAEKNGLALYAAQARALLADAAADCFK
ncbi:MAG: hypothetical protein LBV70_07090 [Candidatus Adiutrix sp.]|jgi:hypothetical protein|nr:hypothetical protein [Candidatus Adiutrix sp.]